MSNGIKPIKANRKPETRPRKAGGGRKAQGKFKKNDAVFSLRLTERLRADIERAAKRNGQSMAQEVQQRLDESFAEDRRTAMTKRRDLRSLARAVMIAAECVERTTGLEWRKDAFTSEALRHAVDLLIRGWGAQGDPIVPESLTQMAANMPAALATQYTTPSGVGGIEGGQVFARINTWGDTDDYGKGPLEWELYRHLFRDLGRPFQSAAGG